ncbi:MAG: cysteine desulfurase [Alphaproteobacteria bacterium]|nr:cysteine desulfurase [Alphaproteobacteria bacterium]|tara:strand:- start:2639 stop:3781 length:1143 start_codon:yes stop_codon:yes gene_type:complete
MSERFSGYLDYNATAPVRPEVSAAISFALDYPGNPSSVHLSGREARSRVESAREEVARLVGVSPGGVVFTSGGTEANNLVLQNSARQNRHVFASAIEHDSILNVLPALQNGATLIPVGVEGLVDVDALAEQLGKNSGPALVSIMLANNETGVIQPVRQVAEIAKDHGAVVHCDAVQGPGKVAVSIADLGVDWLTISAHKFGGPQGIGALIVGDESETPTAMLFGGGQERGRRSGTENVPGIVGFDEAAKCVASIRDESQRVRALRDRLENEIQAAADGVVIVGETAPRLPNTSCIVMPGVPAETQVMSLDLEGVKVSAGAACSSGKVSASHVLKAMGLPDEQAGSAIRVSLGWASGAEDVDQFVAAWTKLRQRLDDRPAP